ncbi:MAG: 6-carboxytetrahydropterin synthase [Pseudomonadales bacterium]|nr:6-carboxytetrahydropterin synthase [Pseudomonadales bacterium]
MNRLTTIEIDKDYLKFSAAHFTVFSATERERLHGHNFRVIARFVAEVNDNGMCVDYSVLKKKVQQVCDDLDEYTLIAANSPYLQITEQDDFYLVKHHNDSMMYLKADTLLLPVANTTVEEFSDYILQQILQDDAFKQACEFKQIDIWVSSGPGQKGMSSWA